MGYAPPRVSKPSQSFEIKIRDRRVSVGVVKLPFYQRRSDSTVVVMGEEMGLRDFRTRYGHPQTLVAQNLELGRQRARDDDLRVYLSVLACDCVFSRSESFAVVAA